MSSKEIIKQNPKTSYFYVEVNSDRGAKAFESIFAREIFFAQSQNTMCSPSSPYNPYLENNNDVY